LAVPKYLRPKSESLEDFVFFLIRAAAAVLILVALGRWALTADVSAAMVPAAAGAAAGVVGAAARWLLDRSDRLQRADGELEA